MAGCAESWPTPSARSAARHIAPCATSPTAVCGPNQHGPRWSQTSRRPSTWSTSTNAHRRSLPPATATPPCVLAHTDDGLVRLLGPEDLDRLAGDVTGFATALRAAAGRAGLHLPTIADPPVCGRHRGRYGRCPGRPFRPTADRAAGRRQRRGPAPGLRSSRCCSRAPAGPGRPVAGPRRDCCAPTCSRWAGGYPSPGHTVGGVQVGIGRLVVGAPVRTCCPHRGALESVQIRSDAGG
jgi:hypothetical protein